MYFHEDGHYEILIAGGNKPSHISKAKTIENLNQEQ